MLSSLLQKAGLRPGLALHSTIPKILMAAAILGGAGSMLSTGSARATTWISKCIFTTAQTQCKGPSGTGWTTANPPGPGPGVPPLQLGDKLLNIVDYRFDNYIAGTPVLESGYFEFSWNDSSTPTVFGDDNWSVETVFDNDIAGTLANNATGSLNYTLAIVGGAAVFESVRLDSTTTGSTNLVSKTIAGSWPSSA